MRVHIFQHTASEGPGRIAAWALQNGHTLSATHFHLGETVPDLGAFDFLAVMGGPMNIYQHRDHPWLVAEKQFLSRAIESGKTVLGICLGSQLLADVLGAKVFQNPELEIGWMPVRMDDAAAGARGFKNFPRELIALHWHGDTFDLPRGATRLASSAACENQAFTFGENIVGLQFHIEVTQPDVHAFIGDATEAQIGSGPFVQTRAEILGGEPHMPATHRALDGLLDALAVRIAS